VFGHGEEEGGCREVVMGGEPGQPDGFIRPPPAITIPEGLPKPGEGATRLRRLHFGSVA
jgi:hypothetical protein